MEARAASGVRSLSTLVGNSDSSVFALILGYFRANLKSLVIFALIFGYFSQAPAVSQFPSTALDKPRNIRGFGVPKISERDTSWDYNN